MMANVDVTNLLQQQGINDYIYERTFQNDGALIYRIRPKDELVCCPHCGSNKVTRNGVKEKVIQILPTGNQPSFVRLKVPIVDCQQCGRGGLINLGFAEKLRKYSNALEQRILKLNKTKNNFEVARSLNITKGTVAEIRRRYSNKSGKPLVKLPFDTTAVAVADTVDVIVAEDENHTGEGKLLVVIIDPETGKGIFSGSGRLQTLNLTTEERTWLTKSPPLEGTAMTGPQRRRNLPPPNRRSSNARVGNR
jgi:RNA polymerase subunit RPABC4/transcription elongation factor Spt4